MKRVFRWICWLGVVAFALLITGLLLKDSLLRSFAERRIRRETGMDARIAKLEVGLLSPTFTMEGFKIYNSPEFGGSVLMDIPELRLEYDRGEAASGKFHVKRARFHLAEVNIVKDKTGKLNVDLMAEKDRQKKPDKPPRSGKGGVEFGGIDVMYLTVEKVRYTDLLKPEENQEFNLDVKDEEVKNLKTAEDVTAYVVNLLLRLYIQENLKNPNKKLPFGLSP